MKRMVPLVLAAVLTASGCVASSGGGGGDNGDNAQLSEACRKGQQEGEVTWYHGLLKANRDQIVEAFRKAVPGIAVRDIDVTGSEGPRRYAAEAEAGAVTADVLTHSESPDFGAKAVKNGWAVSLVNSDIPSLQNYPDEYLDEGSVVTAISPIYVTYNTNLVDNPPREWADLLDPNYKGKIILADPRSILPWMALFNTLYEDEDLGADYLRKLGKQNYQLVASSKPGSQMLAAGEGAILLPSLITVSKPLKEKGAPVDSVMLTPTSGVENQSVLSKTSPHPNAGRCFFNWLHTPEGQVAVNGNYAVSPLGKLDGSPYPLDPEYQRPDGKAARENSEEIVKALGIGG